MRLSLPRGEDQTPELQRVGAFRLAPARWGFLFLGSVFQPTSRSLIAYVDTGPQ
jgi:hypothetical protein